MAHLKSKIKTHLGDEEIATKLVVVWMQLFKHFAKTDYQYDRIFWRMNIGYSTHYLFESLEFGVGMKTRRVSEWRALLRCFLAYASGFHLIPIRCVSA